MSQPPKRSRRKPPGGKPTAHVFGQPRPSSHALQSQASPLVAGSPYQPLPTPPGKAPYRLDLAAVVPDAVAHMHKAGGMVLHMVGDTGGVRDPNPQTLVAAGLERDAARASPLGTPALFYNLGDVIYFDGEAAQYYPQFYEPYEHYPNPIMAIPGNHDGDVFDDGKRVNPEASLATFVRNFCAPRAGEHSPDAGDSGRTAMIQPNVYWTLLTPFATIIGLYTNVPEGGRVEPDQQAWLAGELRDAAAALPVIVALHHPPFSLDTHHSGSGAMSKVLATASAKAKRKPDMVFSGHVHNYQRFTITEPDGTLTPYIVAGNGGYHNLHKVAHVGGQPIVTPYAVPGEDGVVLEKYVDDRFGFMRLEITPSEIVVETYTVPRTQEPWSKQPVLFDRLRYDWKRRRVIP